MTMRSGLLAPAALAVLFVVPTVAWQEGPPPSLEESLRRTLLALESLAGLGQRIEQGELAAVPQLLQATEPALGAEEESGPLLAQLRGEVAALEIELDALHGEPAVERSPVGAHEGGAAIPATTGLDDATRALLAQTRIEQEDAALDGSKLAAAAKAQRESNKRSFEEPGYTADALRLARAYYRQGQYDRAFALLEGRSTDPTEAYWRARCLEKLGRLDEALAAYEVLAADAEGGADAQRAREDLEFLRWRQQFEQRRKSASGGPASGGPVR
jgi:tetratricopeptide (TPR) repeat protein